MEGSDVTSLHDIVKYISILLSLSYVKAIVSDNLLGTISVLGQMGCEISGLQVGLIAYWIAS